MDLSKEQMRKAADSLRKQWSTGDDREAFNLWTLLQQEITKENNVSSRARQNTYRVVFRDSTVVMEDLVFARTMVEAALEAERIRDERWPGWSVYSITLR